MILQRRLRRAHSFARKSPTGPAPTMKTSTVFGEVSVMIGALKCAKVLDQSPGVLTFCFLLTYWIPADVRQVQQSAAAGCRRIGEDVFRCRDDVMTDEAMHGYLIGRDGGRRELNTPVLVLDLDAMERNIAKMAGFARDRGRALRPHVKTHKSVEIARLQRKAGAIGFSCAKLGEAEAMADGGIVDGLLITSPVVSSPAIRRLIELNARTNGLMCVVDHPQNVRA